MTDQPRPHFNEIVARRYSRRQALKGLGSSAAAVALMSTAGGAVSAARAAGAGTKTSLTFQEIAHRYDTTHHVAPGYRADILIRWGDPVIPGAPAFKPSRQTPEAQKMQFGYNNDFAAYLPLPLGSNRSDHGLLFVNHEYTTTPLMLPGYEDFRRAIQTISENDAGVEMEAHGVSIIEIKQDGNEWRVVEDSQLARRISVTTPMELTGPAAGHDRLKTSEDPTGTKVIGTLNNCSGGKTPWGTVLTAEENWHNYFAGERNTLRAKHK
ncbi:MAG: DUF839 domain-containing protein, partial [Alphaproteobacteria bacterium]|nr:DUF839 domain-containing protein [Alphaproteobacteria bacterium]